MSITYTLIGLVVGYFIFTSQRRWERKFDYYIRLTAAISQMIFIIEELIRNRSSVATISEVEHNDFTTAYKNYADTKYLVSLLLPLKYKTHLLSIDKVILDARNRTLNFFGQDFSKLKTDELNKKIDSAIIIEYESVLNNLKPIYKGLLSDLNQDLHPIKTFCCKYGCINSSELIG